MDVKELRRDIDDCRTETSFMIRTLVKKARLKEADASTVKRLCESITDTAREQGRKEEKLSNYYAESQNVGD